jgi:hypothetical protein
VAAWREKNGPHATAQRRNERTKNFLRIIKTSRGGVAAWREKNGSHATAQRRNDEKLTMIDESI